MRRLSKVAGSFRRGSSGPVSDDQSVASNGSNNQPNVRSSTTTTIKTAPKQLQDMDVELSSKAAASNRRMSVSLRERSVRLMNDNSSHSHQASTTTPAPLLPPSTDKATKQPPRSRRNNRREEEDDGLPPLLLTSVTATSDTTTSPIEEEHHYAGCETLVESPNTNNNNQQPPKTTQRGRKTTTTQLVPDIKVLVNDQKPKNEKPPKPTRKKPTRQRSSSLSELRVPRRERANKRGEPTNTTTKNTDNVIKTTKPSSPTKDNSNNNQFSNGFVRDSGAALDRIKAQNEATKERRQKQQEKYRKRQQEHMGEIDNKESVITTKEGEVKKGNKSVLTTKEGRVKKKGNKTPTSNSTITSTAVEPESSQQQVPKQEDPSGSGGTKTEKPAETVVAAPATNDEPKNDVDQDSTLHGGTIANGGKQNSEQPPPTVITETPASNDAPSQNKDTILNDGSNELPVDDDDDEANAPAVSKTNDSLAASKSDTIVEDIAPASDTTDTTMELTASSAESMVGHDADATLVAASNKKDETQDNNVPACDGASTMESTTPEVVGHADEVMEEATKEATKADKENETDDNAGSATVTTKACDSASTSESTTPERLVAGHDANMEEAPRADDPGSAPATIAAELTSSPVVVAATTATENSEQPLKQERAGRAKATRKRPTRQRSRSLTSMGRPLRGGTRADRAQATTVTATPSSPSHNEMSSSVVQKKKTHTFYFDDDYRDNDPVVKLDATEVEQQVQKLRDKVQKLQKQLEETRQNEIQQLEEARAKCRALKESFAVAIPTTKTQTSEDLSGSVQQSKDIITYLKQENANRRKENQTLKVNLFDLHQKTVRLEKATLSTLNCVQELEEVHLVHETEKNEALYEYLKKCRIADDKLSSELDFRTQGGLMEHRICQRYNQTMEAMQRLFQESCDDEDLVLSITELPTVIVATTRTESN